MQTKLYIILVIFLGCCSLNAQQVEKSIFGTFLLENGTVHTVDNGVITADVLVSDGYIKEIGTAIELPESATRIDCTGKHIYPGFIDSGTHVGLEEISSLGLTSDYSDNGDVIPHMEALTAVNPNSVIIPVTRVNGITTVLSMPDGKLFPGTSTLIDLVGYTPQQMSTDFKGVHLNFPSASQNFRGTRKKKDIDEERTKETKMLKETWEAALLYTKIEKEAPTSLDYNPAMKRLSEVINKEIPLIIEVNKASDILKAIEWQKDKNINVILSGVAEGWRVADDIAEAGLPVIAGPVLSLPSRSYDPYDIAYRNPGILLSKGIKVAIRTKQTENVRNLPYHAGFAAAYGMGKEEALRAITLTPAEIFGVETTHGSITEGKLANLFVCDGDPFETKTQLTHLFIKGWKVPLESRQTLLYDEFLNRSPGIKVNKK